MHLPSTPRRPRGGPRRAAAPSADDRPAGNGAPSALPGAGAGRGAALARHLRRRARAGLLSGLVAALVASCAHGRGATPRGTAAKDPPSWIDAPLVGRGAPGPLPRGDDAFARLARLDRLLDLFDAARMTGDAAARDLLWDALGGHGTGRGQAATAEATLRLLAEAYALEDAPLDPERRALVADLIQLLTTDAFSPLDAEELEARVGAYRELAASGHPRVRDNAAIRLYDHGRASLRASLSAPPRRRVEIALHTLYISFDNISPWLADAPHARAPWPDPGPLWELVARALAPLRALPRWAPVLRALDREDAGMAQDLAVTLPAARDAAKWGEIPNLPLGTGRAESLAPILAVDATGATADLAAHLPLPERAAELSAAVERALTRDGRGRLLMVLPRRIPAPVLAQALRSAAAGGVEVLEVAALEPRLPAARPKTPPADGAAMPPPGVTATPGGPVVTQLPLDVARGPDDGPRGRALAAARVRLLLSGRGLRASLDGALLPGPPARGQALVTLLDRLAAAFPRERVLALTLTPDVAPDQLHALMRLALGGPEPRAEALGWLVQAPPPGPARPQAARRLDARLALAGGTTTLEQPFPLREEDQARLDRAAEGLAACLPEWEAPAPRDGLAVGLVFDGGLLADVTLPKPRRRRGPTDLARLRTRACLWQIAGQLHLYSHTDHLVITARLRPPA